MLTVTDEPLFPRYLFIRLDQGDSGPQLGAYPFHQGRQSAGQLWGVEPAKVADSTVDALRV